MPRSLADGKLRFVVLDEEPANPDAPTALELNAGVYASPAILTSDFAWGATDSEKVAEKALNEANNANAIAAGNYSAAASIWRKFVTGTGAPDTVNEELWALLSEKGTTLWGYARETGLDADAVFATGHEIYLGAEFITDTPQPPSDRGGFIKRRVPFEIQRAWDNIVVAAT